MVVTTSILSQHTLAVLHRNEKSIDNLKLQKVMFLSLCEYLGTHGCDLPLKYTEPFVAWRHGAVIPSDYHYYKKYGTAYIMENGKYHETLSSLDSYILKFARYSTWELVRYNKKLHFWNKHKERILCKGEYPVYSLEDIKEDSELLYRVTQVKE